AAIAATPSERRTEASSKSLLEYVKRTDGERAKAAAAVATANRPVPKDAETVRLEKTVKRFSIETPVDSRLVRLRSDVSQSEQQLKQIRLTAAEDLTWALINSPAFLFNH
ncbi:MAG: hypothetical protein AAGJ83_09865, partial [Planctomycetota bacterium]